LPQVRELLDALATFVLRYPHSRDVFTAVHQTFLNACVRLRLYQVALPILNNRVAQIDKSIYPITYLDNLLYHYYGAFIYIALKQWAEAEEFLEMVVAAPISSGVPSAIQMEAMKKLSLVQLIRYGTLKPLPKYVPGLFAKAIKQSSYGQFAKVYPAGAVQLVAEKEQKTFFGDFNVGLVREAIDMAPRWKLRTLTKTYLTLSLAEIGKEIGMADDVVLRSLVENMVCSSSRYYFFIP
jgi:COP9 signalosome complex subunit 3